MNYKEAITILGLPEKWDNEMLKKAYRQKALRYHPDKNNSDNASFQFDMVKRAFEYLTNCETHNYCSTNSNVNVDFSYLFDQLKPFDNDKLKKIQKLFGACKDVVGLTKEMVNDVINNKNKHNAKTGRNNTCATQSQTNTSQNPNEVNYEIEVTLKQMLNDEVYMLKHNGLSLLVPLWFDEVYYDNDDNHDIVKISIIPQLPEGVSINTENNHMYVKVNRDEYLSHDNKQNSRLFDVKQFQSPNAEQVDLDLDLSKMKSGSKITLWNVGLLKVFETTPDKMNTSDREGITFIII